MQFERDLAARGGRTRAGSGNQWNQRGDVVLGPLLFSAKATAERTWAQTRRQLAEASEMALGTGLLPALAVLDDDGAELVVMSVDDLVAALASDSKIEARASSTDRRRAADTPSILRD